jgi:microcystin-dependent protein
VAGSAGALVGSITMWPTTTPPTGYFLCNGSTYDTVIYSALFAVLGTNTLPDFRGKFTRGYDPTNIYDPDTRSILTT